MFIAVPREVFLGLFRGMGGREDDRSAPLSLEEERDYVSNFGTCPDTTSYLWTLLHTETAMLDKKARPIHLLQALKMMKVYSNEDDLCKGLRQDGGKQVSKKTLRKWAWTVIHAIADLVGPVIHEKFDKRFDGAPPGVDKVQCFDGVHCRTQEPRPLWSGNFSFKSNGAGLAYQLGTSWRGDINHLEGPFICSTPDDNIFRQEIINELEIGEVCEGDRLYRDKIPEVFRRDHSDESRIIARRFRARHEVANSRLKRLKCLATDFRHGNEKHSDAFRAAAVITQLEIETGKPLFEI